MAIVLSSTTCQDLWQESREQAKPADPHDVNDRVIECPSLFGQGYKRDISLRNGVDLTFHRYQFHDDLVSLNGQPGETGCLEWVFNLSSTFRFWDESYITNGRHYAAGLVLPGGNSEDLACDVRVEVDIHLELERFKALISSDFDILPPDLQRLLDGDEAFPFSSVRRITPAMQQVLQQMLDCPYQGVIKQMYLESKSVEVLTLWLEQATAVAPEPTAIAKLPADDIDRIHRAKDILLQKAAHPPSLLELAHQVGLNDRKLKQGFRQVFGTTVFGYLHNHRMELARSLLATGEMNIKEVAQSVGYSSQSRFCDAFKRKYGTTPSHYLKQNVKFFA